MVTRNKQWQEFVLPHCVKFKQASLFNQVIVIKPGGCEAYAEILANMANKLDASKDIIERQEEVIVLMERQMRILQKNHVTPEGNDV